MDSDLVEPVRAGKGANATKIISHEVHRNEHSKQAMIGVAKLPTIPVETESPKVMATSKYGSMTVEGIQTARPTKRKLPGRDVLDVCPNVPFSDFVTNFSKITLYSAGTVYCFTHRFTRMYRGTLTKRRIETNNNGEGRTIKGCRESANENGVSH